MSFSVVSLGWRIGGRTILDDISFEVEPGRMLGLIGPNGSGKTSLLRLLAGLKQPHAGRVLLDRADLKAMPRRSVARRVAFVEQHASTNANLRVIDVVKLGRFPHRSLFSGWTAADEAAVEAALARAGMLEKRHASWLTLSGGERQRAHIARALAQTPSELILDEPTNHLDIQHQIGLLRLVSSLGVTSVIALHDLNHAAMFCDGLVVLERGRIAAIGSPADVLTEHLVRDVFAVDASITPGGADTGPHIRYRR